MLSWFQGALFLIAASASAYAQGQQPQQKSVAISDEIRLHYMESGGTESVPIIFIHGTLGDMRMWTDYVTAFGSDYRAIAYSRRYNYPNDNPLKKNSNHSTKVEADDLAAFIRKLNLPPAHIVGYSYGGYTALNLAVDHPDLVRTLVLAEPPLIPWLADLRTNREEGIRLFQRQETHFVKPARDLIEQQQNVDGAIKVFIDYVVRDGAFERAPPEVKQVWHDNRREFKAEVLSDDMFAPLSRKQVAGLNVPTLMISGEASIGALRLTDDELERTLPMTIRIQIPKATHLMWQENPVACTYVLARFFTEH